MPTQAGTKPRAPPPGQVIATRALPWLGACAAVAVILMLFVLALPARQPGDSVSGFSRLPAYPTKPGGGAVLAPVDALLCQLPRINPEARLPSKASLHKDLWPKPPLVIEADPELGASLDLQGKVLRFSFSGPDKSSPQLLVLWRAAARLCTSLGGVAVEHVPHDLTVDVSVGGGMHGLVKELLAHPKAGHMVRSPSVEQAWNQSLQAASPTAARDRVLNVDLETMRRLAQRDAGWRLFMGKYGVLSATIPVPPERPDEQHLWGVSNSSSPLAWGLRHWLTLGSFPPCLLDPASCTIDERLPSAFVRAPTLWGALRGLTALGQALEASLVSDTPCPGGVVWSFPVRWWRGFMVDTARHFMPLRTLLSHVRAMGHSSLNVLHWHIVDAQSFPLAVGPVTSWLASAGAWSSPRNPARAAEAAGDDFPSLPLSFQSYGRPSLEWRAQSPWVYNTSDVLAVIALAADVGARVVPEIDTPAHTGSWAGAVPQAVVSCPQEQLSRQSGLHPQTPLKTLDIAVLNPVQHGAAVAAHVLSEVAAIFPDSFLHMGGDELVRECWEEDAPTKAWARSLPPGSKGIPVDVAQTAFTSRLLNDTQLGRRALSPAPVSFPVTTLPHTLPWSLPLPDLTAEQRAVLHHKTSLFWQETFEHSFSSGKRGGGSLPRSGDVVGPVMPWVFWGTASADTTVRETAAGRGVVWAVGTYLDVVGDWCDLYKESLATRVGPGVPPEAVWGGETMMWAEEVDRGNAQCRTWPRASAVAEKLWSMDDALAIMGGWGDQASETVHTPAIEGAAVRLALHAAQLQRMAIVEAADVEPGKCSVDKQGRFGFGPGAKSVVVLPPPGLARCSGIDQNVQRPPVGESHRVRFMSWNIRNGGERRAESVMDAIRAEVPDIVVIIEATEWNRNGPQHPETPAAAAMVSQVRRAGFAHAALLEVKTHFSLAVLSSSKLRVLWSNDGSSFERGLLAVETRGVVVVATHLNAHNAIARKAEAAIVASILPSLRELAVRVASPGERLHKWGCRPSELDECAARVPVALAGDMNTLSPLDAECHKQEELLKFLSTGVTADGTPVRLPERIRAKYMQEPPEMSGWAIDYRPMEALLGQPRGPPPALRDGEPDPVWWTNATWHESTQVGCEHGRAGGGQMADLFAVTEWADADRCVGSQPTSLSMIEGVDVKDIPPFRLDYVLLGPASACGQAKPVCTIVRNEATKLLSDHFPVLCALDVPTQPMDG
jgi:hexosaminidase